MLKANSFLGHCYLFLKDVKRISSLSETPKHAWVVRGNQILP